MLRLAVYLLFSSTAYAETYIADAFGILPEAKMSQARASWAGLQTGRNSVIVNPQTPKAVLLFIGAKSLVAGKDEGHAVALSLDDHGNLVQDMVARIVLETNGPKNVITNDGLAGVFFRPAPQVGTFTGGAEIRGIQSARALYRVVADLESVELAIQPSKPLKSENFERLSTEDLVDQFGNPVADGVGTTMHLTDKNGATTLLVAPVRKAQAEATFLVRDLKAGGQLNVVLGSNGAITSVDLEPLEAAGPTDVRLWQTEGLDALTLRVGPVNTDAGHLMVDGAQVATTIVAGDVTISRKGWLLDGYFQTLLPLSGGLPSYEVTVSTDLGEQITTVPVSEMPTEIRGAE